MVGIGLQRYMGRGSGSGFPESASDHDQIVDSTLRSQSIKTILIAITILIAKLEIIYATLHIGLCEYQLDKIITQQYRCCYYQ